MKTNKILHQFLKAKGFIFCSIRCLFDRREYENNTKNLNYYIYNLNDGYIIFIGITSNEDNANKLKGYFKKRDMILI